MKISREIEIDLVDVEKSAWQNCKKCMQCRIDQSCFLFIGITPNFFPSFSFILVALDNRPKNKRKKPCKLKTRNKSTNKGKCEG
jgi:hypothetical protein